MATNTRRKPSKPPAQSDAPVYRRVFRAPAGVALNDATEVVKAELLALGCRPVEAPYIESDETEGAEHVVTWAARYEDNN